MGLPVSDSLAELTMQHLEPTFRVLGLGSIILAFPSFFHFARISGNNICLKGMVIRMQLIDDII